MHEVVHRFAEAKHQAESKQQTFKQELMSTFLKDHGKAYAVVGSGSKPVQRAPKFSEHSKDEIVAAKRKQSATIEARKEVSSKPVPRGPPKEVSSPRLAKARPLRPSDLPRSPIDVATEDKYFKSDSEVPCFTSPESKLRCFPPPSLHDICPLSKTSLQGNCREHHLIRQK